MPSKSVAQQRAAGMALAAKRGKISPAKLRGAARDMYRSMTIKELRKFAGTQHRELPRHKAVAECLANMLLYERDDLSTLPLSRAQKAYARLTARDLLVSRRHGMPWKVVKNDRRIRDVTNQRKFKGYVGGPDIFPNMDKVGRVRHAINSKAWT